MGPGRNHERFARGFVLFIAFVIVTAFASCQPRRYAQSPGAKPSLVHSNFK